MVNLLLILLDHEESLEFLSSVVKGVIFFVSLTSAIIYLGLLKVSLFFSRTEFL